MNQPSRTTLPSLKHRLNPRPNREEQPSAPKAPAGERAAPKVHQESRQSNRPPVKVTASPETAPTKPAPPRSAAATSPPTLSTRLSPEVHNLVKHAIDADPHLTLAELVFTAIEATYAELPALLQREKAEDKQTRSQKAPGQLFSRPRHRTAQTMVQIAPVVTRSDRDTIDNMSREAGATSRSQYVNAALRLYLTDHTSSEEN